MEHDDDAFGDTHRNAEEDERHVVDRALSLSLTLILCPNGTAGPDGDAPPRALPHRRLPTLYCSICRLSGGLGRSPTILGP
jgi:hypothetical protein